MLRSGALLGPQRRQAVRMLFDMLRLGDHGVDMRSGRADGMILSGCPGSGKSVLTTCSLA